MEGKKEIDVYANYFKTKKGKLKVSSVSDNMTITLYLVNRESFKSSLSKENFKALDKYFEKQNNKILKEKRKKLLASKIPLKEMFEKFKESFDKSMPSEGVEYHYKEKDPEK